MEDIHRQHINSTKNAGSSLANCDFVSKTDFIYHSNNIYDIILKI